MKTEFKHGKPRTFVLGLLFSAVVASCGAEKSDPEAVTLDELQNAKGLTITETGTGEIRLTWSGNNGEDDFTGYNIYGALMSDDLEKAMEKEDLVEGASLQLVDNEGEPRPEAKAILQLMSYNGTDFETPATAEPSDSEDVQFKYYPVYKTKDVFPTCIPKLTAGANQACEDLTEEGTEHAFYGTATYDITGLKAGSKYCFFVLSTLDSGKTVAMTTSEMACITPMVHANDLSLTIAADSHQKIDLKATRTACTEKACAITAAEYTRDDGKTFCANDDKTTDLLCIEQVSGLPGFTSGQYVAINDLGYFEGGFSDSALGAIPELTGFDAGESAVAFGGGYSISGQSLPILANHIYAVANRADASATPSSFKYDLYYATAVSATSASFEVRIAK